MKSAKQPSSRIRLLAIDLDDTLLTEDLKISPANSQAIRAAEAIGVQVVLASGRAPQAMHPFIQELGLDKTEGYMIAFNGSTIIRTDTGVEEWGIKLDVDLLAEVWDLAEKRGRPLQTYLKDEIIYNEENEFTELDHKLTGIPIRKVSRAEFLAEPRVMLNSGGDPELLIPLEAEFNQVFGGRANMFRSKPFFFEIMHIHADKGFALERLAAMHRIDRSAVMAIGDAMNDAGMLRWAGWPVAMANAVPAIQNLAAWVTTKSHGDDGVAEAIDRFILHA